MKKKLLIVIIIILCLIIGAAGFFIFLLNKEITLMESYRVVKVEAMEGNVELKRNGNKVDMVTDMRLIPNDKCKTEEASSLELLVDDDKHILAEEKTEFEIAATGDSDKGSVTIKLIEGNELFTIDNKLSEDDSFKVKTTNAVLSVRGTQFRVIYDSELGSTFVEVFEGTVWGEGANEQEVELNAGDTATFYDDRIETYVSDDTFAALTERIENVINADIAIRSECADALGLDIYDYDYYDEYGLAGTLDEAFGINEVVAEPLEKAREYSNINQVDLSEKDALAMIEELDGYIASLESGKEDIEVKIEEYMALNGWRDAYKSYVSGFSSSQSWMLFDVYGDSIPELMYYDSNENSGNGRWGYLVFATYDGAGGVKQLGKEGWEVNQGISKLDGQPVTISISGGTGDWWVYKLDVTDSGISTGTKLGSGNYKSLDNWASKCGGTNVEKGEWYGSGKYYDMTITQAIDSYQN